MKITSGQVHLMRLVLAEADADGWAEVSSQVWPVAKALPDDLVEKRVEPEGRGALRLTEGGRAVVKYF